MALTAKQRARLRSLAHPLKPVVQVGASGVTDAVLRSVEEALHAHELIKVKVLQGAPETPDDAAERLGREVPGAFVVQRIGRTVVLYRPHPEEPRIRIE